MICPMSTSAAAASKTGKPEGGVNAGDDEKFAVVCDGVDDRKTL